MIVGSESSTEAILSRVSPWSSGFESLPFELLVESEDGNDDEEEEELLFELFEDDLLEATATTTTRTDTRASVRSRTFFLVQHPLLPTFRRTSGIFCSRSTH